jgi:hypothetical protein
MKGVARRSSIHLRSTSSPADRRGAAVLERLHNSGCGRFGEQEDAVFGDFVAGDEPLPEERVEVSLRSQALDSGAAGAAGS